MNQDPFDCRVFRTTRKGGEFGLPEVVIDRFVEVDQSPFDQYQHLAWKKPDSSAIMLNTSPKSPVGVYLPLSEYNFFSKLSANRGGSK